MRKTLVFPFFVLFAFSVLAPQTAFSSSEPRSTSVEPHLKKEKGSVEKVVSWYLDNMSYGTITLLMVVESSFVPFPSEVIIPPAAYKASQPKSELNYILIVVFGTLGAIIGALINYFLAVYLGRPVIYKFADSRFGHFCLLDRKKVEKAEAYFRKYGNSSTFVGRLVPGIRQLISIPAGLSKMNLGNFILYTALGAGMWNIVLAVLGYIAQGQSDIIEKYSHELSIGLLIVGILFVAYLLYNGLKKKK